MPLIGLKYNCLCDKKITVLFCVVSVVIAPQRVLIRGEYFILSKLPF